MPKRTACQTMMDYVNDYLDGTKSRQDFDAAHKKLIRRQMKRFISV